jgi:hypothetical protein
LNVATSTGRIGRGTEATRRPGVVARVRRWRHGVPLLLITALVALGNLPYLTHIFDPNPLNLLTGLSTITHPGILAGSTATDPNSGLTAQTFGHLAALDWLHGRVPWWNPLEGFGAPLAGEMQSAALFPLTLLLVFANGQIYFHAALELIAGGSTYALLVELRLHRTVATGGAVVFALCGTFAWFSHAPVNPIAFLPLMLFGVEYVANRLGSAHHWGWLALALGVALSLYAGFPETAYVDAVFATVWVVARLIEMPRAGRVRFVLALGQGVGIGLLLSAPILVAFVDYLPVGNLGGNGGLFGKVSLLPPAFSQVVLPYVYGPINAFSNSDKTGALNVIWGNVGGYIGTPLLILGAIGTYGRRHRALRVALVLWLLVSLGRTFGITVFQSMINAVPGMRDVAFYRYSAATWVLAAVVLACLGFNEILTRQVPRWWIAASTAVSLLVVALCTLGAQGLLGKLAGAANYRPWEFASVGWAVAAIATICLAALFLRGRVRGLIIGGVVIVDAIGMFVVPQLSAPTGTAYDAAPVQFLAQHLGTSRFYTIGPIQPNYGSYFGLPQLNSNDVPEPKLYDADVKARLGLTPGLAPQPKASVLAAVFLRHLAAYEGSGVKYLVTPPNVPLPALAVTEHLRLVFSDRTLSIYRLPTDGDLFASTSRGCDVTSQQTDHAVVDCFSAGELVRRETFMKGWSATRNGRPVGIAKDGAFQRIPVPAGRSVVSFSFTPPFTNWALLAFLLGSLATMVGIVSSRRRHSRPPRHARSGSRNRKEPMCQDVGGRQQGVHDETAERHFGSDDRPHIGRMRTRGEPI